MIENKIRALIFDFDGVLVDTNEIKRSAFHQLFNQYPKITSQVIDEAISIGGSRYEIIKRILERHGDVSLRHENEVKKYAERYNDIVQSFISENGLVPGGKESLVQFFPLYPLYINSATPIEALVESVERLAIRPLFRGIYGKPMSKVENLVSICELEKITPADALFVGDGDIDLQAAREVGCQFVGVKEEGHYWRELDFPVVKAVAELPSLLKLTIN